MDVESRQPENKKINAKVQRQVKLVHKSVPSSLTD